MDRDLGAGLTRLCLRAAGVATAATLATASLATAAQAAVYQVVQSGPDEITVLDPAAVEPIPGASRQFRAWSVNVKRVLVEGGPKQPGYVRALSDYDCAAKKVRWRSFTAYSRFGSVVMRQDNLQPDWAGSATDPGLKAVCADAAGRSAVSAASMTQLVLSLMQAWDEAAPLPPLQPADPPPAPARRAHRKARS